MAKVSPALRAFNTGELSPLVDARADLDRYPASARQLRNIIGSAQGPAIRRSGSKYLVPYYDETKKTRLVEFVYSNDDFGVLEFAPGRLRLLDYDGLITHPTQAVTEVLAVSPMELTIPGLDAEIGDQIKFSGFDPTYTVNGKTATVTAKAVDDYTFDIDYDDVAGVLAAGPMAYRVFHVDNDYTEADLARLRYVQQGDIVYLFTGGAAMQKLSRLGDFDWTLGPVDLVDGPFMDEDIESGDSCKPNVSGSAVPPMTSNTLPSGTAASNDAGANSWHGFSEDLTQYWTTTAGSQTGWLEYAPAVPFALAGYTIYAARENADTSYTALDYAPGTWEMQGWDGAAWITLDNQIGYVLYDNYRSGYFKVNDAVVYQKYRINITQCKRNGAIRPRIARLVLVPRTPIDVTLEFSGIVGVNKGLGFDATEIGRLIRLQGSDNSWRSAKIKSVTDTDTVVVNFQEDVLPDAKEIHHFRLGYYSDRTGWPTCGAFSINRLWLGGGAPNLICASVQNSPETFSPTDYLGDLLDTSGLSLVLGAKKQAIVRWIAEDTRGVLVGTSAGEWSLLGTDREKGLTATGFRAVQATKRGSADVEPVQVDDQVVYIHRARRSVREFAYLFERDGYASPSMSQLATHIGAKRFAEMVYTAEPHAIIWIRCDDGEVAGLTYDREEGTIGWHQHEFTGEIETMTVTPSPSGKDDILWFGIKRTINGVVRRYIERVTEFWDDGFTLDDAFYVNSGLRYSGAPTSIIYGLYHLIGEDIEGLADGKAFTATVADDGSIELPQEASEVVAGLGTTALLETLNPDAGARDGTAHGKTKRANGVAINVWDTFGGQVGIRVTQKEGAPIEFDAIPFTEEPYVHLTTESLITGVTDFIPLPENYGPEASILLRQTEPYPFNIRAVYPQLHTQDR